MNRIYLWLKTFYHHHKLQCINLFRRQQLFSLSTIFLNIRQHRFPIVFWYVLCIVSQWRVVWNFIFRFFESSSPSKSYHLYLSSFLFSFLIRLLRLTTLILNDRLFSFFLLMTETWVIIAGLIYKSISGI